MVNVDPDLAGKVMTVLGPIEADALGITLCHEHLLISLLVWWLEPEAASEKAAAFQPVSMSNLGRLRRNPHAVRDNLVMDDVDLAIAEALRFRRAGGRTIVDVTPVGIGRDQTALRTIAVETGLHIVAGCGYYVHLCHPPEIDHKSIDDIAAEMIRDLTEGINHTGVRAGIIGEIGTFDPIMPNEVKVLRAAAHAHRQTGAPIIIHPHPFSKLGLQILNILEEAGADLNQVIMSHLDLTVEDLAYHQAIARRGAYVCYDGWGNEGYYERFNNFSLPKDVERVYGVQQLIAAGCLDRVLLSHDIFAKMLLTAYGGFGYAHLLETVRPMFRQAGLTEAHLNTMMIENPQRVLAWRSV
jgi:phosphotriesterase-related protein